jgi:hypothetical protein
MTPTLAGWRWQEALRRLSLALVLLPLGVSPVLAQTSNGFADALFALRRLQRENVTKIDGRLYGGLIDSSIYQGDGNNDTFTERDFIVFSLSSNRGPQQSVDVPRRSVNCTGTRSQFEDCLIRNASDVLAILFPRSMSESVSGLDAAHYQAQQSLLVSALGSVTSSEGGRLKRSDIGGLVEYEWFVDDEAGNGRAWQGFYRLKGGPVSIRGRFAELRQDALTTRSATVALGVHPSFEISKAAQWRAGVDLRSGLLYSRSSALDLGSLDFGGGVWTSAAKDFARLRIGGAGVFQGSRSYVPPTLVGRDLEFLARTYNDVGITYDVAYGSILGVILSNRTSLNVKLMETRAVESTDLRPPSRVILAGLCYLVGGHTPVDFGYKLSTGGGLVSHSIFLQGNYRF